MRPSSGCATSRQTMPTELHIVGLQSDLHWRDPDANLNQFNAAFASIEAEDIDMVILPEMFTTGFSWPPLHPQNGQDAVLVWMQTWANRLQAAIVGSTGCHDSEGHPKNRCWFVPPTAEGSPKFYDKRHLFTLAGEHRHFKAGENRVEVEFRGFRILLQVCYDLRFPVFVRNHNDTPYDLAIYVANWPEARAAAWRTLLQARAIENQCFVIGFNRSGQDGNGHRYSGDSLIVDSSGDLLADAGSTGQPYALQASLSMQDLLAFREKLPFLQDADRRKSN